MSDRSMAVSIAVLAVAVWAAGHVHASQAPPQAVPFERSNIEGVISGVVQQGHVFKTVSGNFYEVTGVTIQVVVEVQPKVTVLRRGESYILDIEGFDEPIACRKLTGVTESRLQNESKGFAGDTVFKLGNGQLWIQTDGYYHYHYQYAPKVLLYQDGTGYRLRLEGVDRSVRVAPLTIGR